MNPGQSRHADNTDVTLGSTSPPPLLPYIVSPNLCSSSESIGNVLFCRISLELRSIDEPIASVICNTIVAQVLQFARLCGVLEVVDLSAGGRGSLRAHVNTSALNRRTFHYREVSFFFNFR